MFDSRSLFCLITICDLMHCMWYVHMWYEVKSPICDRGYCTATHVMCGYWRVPYVTWRHCTNTHVIWGYWRAPYVTGGIVQLHMWYVVFEEPHMWHEGIVQLHMWYEVIEGPHMWKGVLYNYTCDMWLLKSPICYTRAFYRLISYYVMIWAYCLAYMMWPDGIVWPEMTTSLCDHCSTAQYHVWTQANVYKHCITMGVVHL